MQTSRSRLVVLACSAGVAAALLCGRLAVGAPFRKSDFKGVKTVDNAVKLARQHLTDAGKPEYAALISEKRVRAAIRNGVRSYQIIAADVTEKRFPGIKEHFEKDVKPVCLRIADEGEWPSGCSIDAFFSLVEERDGEKVTYDGIGLSLRIETADAGFKEFALPILTLFYGKCEVPCE